MVVGVVRAPRHKQTMFTLEERIGFIEQSLADRDTSTVDGFATLVVEFAREHGARCDREGAARLSATSSGSSR